MGYTYHQDVRRQNKHLLADNGIFGENDIKPGMVFKMGDNGILIIDTIQMVWRPSSKCKPIKRRQMVYTKIYKNGKRRQRATQVSNLYNRVIKEVIIG
tara:strand:- start:495 stop:788 length:294 start_codon:yes stop_codon:yes gene_type:complete